jgi:hypothetical protein
MFEVLFGIPEIKKRWDELNREKAENSISQDDLKLLKKWAKAIAFLANDPRHPSLKTHEITTLSKKFGHRVWQSYLENRTPKPYRLFWVYGPRKKQITLIGLERHPDSTNHDYLSVPLSELPEVKSGKS